VTGPLRRARCLASRGPRPAAGLGVVSGLGVWPEPALDARFSRGVFGGQGFAFAPSIGGSATVEALLRLGIHRSGATPGKDAPFGCTSPHASAFTTGSRSQRSILGPPVHERRILRPPQHQLAPETPDERSRQPPGRGPCGGHLRRRPRQRSSTLEPPAAAHQQAQSPYGRAPATSRRPQPSR
jgi:hypothetical protein